MKLNRNGFYDGDDDDDDDDDDRVTNKQNEIWSSSQHQPQATKSLYLYLVLQNKGVHNARWNR